MKIIPTAVILFLLATAGHAETVQRWSIRQAVEYALRHNPDTTIARERIIQAEAKSVAARAVDYPRLMLTGEYSITNNPIYSFGNILNQGTFDNSIDFNSPGRSDRLAVQAAAQYRLYHGGQDKAQQEIARIEIARAQSGRRQTEQLLGFAVVKSWQHIMQAQQMVKLQQETLTTLNASLEVATARYEAGDLLQQEILAIKAQTARVQEQQIAAEHRLALARQSFLTLLGLPKQPFVLQETEQTLQPPPALDINKREEMKALTELERRTAAELDKARGNTLPTVDTYAGYGAEYGPELDGDGSSWQAGLKMNYTLFDGHNSTAKIAGVRAQLREIAAQKQKLALALQLELERAKLDYQQAEKRLAVTAIAEKAASEAARLTRLQFGEGTVLASTLIDYETRLADARAHHLSAKADTVIAVANLRRAAGYGQFASLSDKTEEEQSLP